MKKAPPAEMCV